MGLWLALIACIALSALFSATETAFSASNKVRLKNVEGREKERAQIALDLLEKYDSLLTTVLIGNNVVNIAGTAIATLLFTTRILPGREDLATTAASAVMTVVVLFLGEVGPKTLAKQQPERFAMAVSPLMRTLVVALHPLDLLFSLYRRLLSRLIKPEPEIYQLLCSKYSLKMEECVFIDDKQANTDAAKALGMQAITFRGYDEAVRELEEIAGIHPE